MFNKDIRTEIDINASAARVWNLLTDFAGFPDWNPFIRSAIGEARSGTWIEVNLQPTGARGMKFKPIVIKAEPNRELRWLGHLWIRGLFDGEHIFIIEPLGANRVHFIQRELINGLLVPILSCSIEKNTKRGFEEMNRALKVRAEKPAPEF